MRKFLTLFILFLVSGLSFAQIPSGYYNTADGQTGFVLKTALHIIIDNHSDNGYSALWSLYETSDVKSNGKVWDMYSDCDFTFVTDQDMGSGGTAECDKFNREHSFPKSWFNDSSPMINDPFHVIPADKKVNSIRGNYAYGETASPSYTSLNGSKLGSNSLAGYSGTVFEPADEYKGDFARSYFYMATRYEDVVSGWETNDTNGDAMLNGTSDQVFENWALEMLLAWHQNDPVSQKEIDRNDAIYDYQGNRNPFIDHPEYVSCIWENSCEGNGPVPVLSVSVSSLPDFGSVDTGSTSTSKNYSITGTDLTDNVIITAPQYFEISLDNAVFSSSLTLVAGSDFILPTLNATTIYTRFMPNAGNNGVRSGAITINSSGASTKNVNVQGTEIYNEEAVEVNIAISDLLHVYDGTHKSAVVSTVPANVNYSVTYNSLNESPINAGTYTVKVDIIESNYVGSATAILNIDKAEAIIEVDNLKQDADGKPKPITVTTIPEGINTKVLYNGSEEPPTEARSYLIQVSIDDPNYFGEDFIDVLLLVTANFDAIEKAGISIYPNPAINYLQISIEVESKIFIYNASGKMVNVFTISGSESIDITHFKPGVYFLKIEDKSGINGTKLLIER